MERAPSGLCVRCLARRVPDALKPHTARVLADINAGVDAVVVELGDAPEEEALASAARKAAEMMKRPASFVGLYDDSASGASDASLVAFAAFAEEEAEAPDPPPKKRNTLTHMLRSRSEPVAASVAVAVPSRLPSVTHQLATSGIPASQNVVMYCIIASKQHLVSTNQSSTSEHYP